MSSIQIQGTLKEILPIQKGEDKSGPWEKQDIIIETKDQFPKMVCIAIWGDKLDKSF